MQSNKLKISALILAAGKGSRIGLPKWKLEYNGISFLNIIKNSLKKNGINCIYCTYRTNSKPDISEIYYLENKEPELGMFSSVYYGTREVSSTDGILIWPVDHPFVEENTVTVLFEKFIKNPDKVIKPIFEKAGGHPIILPWKLIEKIKFRDYNGGLRQFINDSGTDILKVPLADPNILKNINTKTDLHFKQL
ncbi:MAG: NTP transferase domain-containing protein [Victivallales bacterium]|nr:NTP transferase domain-containing protein [Victivallales bacterium]